MGVTILAEWRVNLSDGSSILLYSRDDLTFLDSALHYCVSIERTGRAGLGSDGRLTHDGVLVKVVEDTERGTPREGR